MPSFILSGALGGSGHTGGNATSTAYGPNNGAATVDSQAKAETRGPQGSTIANATAIGKGQSYAAAIADGGNAALAHALATGSGGTSSANASSGSGGTLVTAYAQSPVGSPAEVESRSSVGLAAPSPALGAGLQAYSFVTALPTTNDSLAALSSAPAIRKDFDLAGQSTMFGLASIGAAYPVGGDTTKTFMTGFSESVDLSTIGEKQDLLLGFTDLSLAGLFSDLQIIVTENGKTVANYDATSAAGLADQTIDLGSLVGSSGPLTLGFAFDFTASTVGASFSTDLLFGNSTIDSGIPAGVPEPRSPTLLGFGFGALLLYRRSRRAGNRTAFS